MALGARSLCRLVYRQKAKEEGELQDLGFEEEGEDDLTESRLHVVSPTPRTYVYVVRREMCLQCGNSAFKILPPKPPGPGGVSSMSPSSMPAVPATASASASTLSRPETEQVHPPRSAVEAHYVIFVLGQAVPDSRAPHAHM